MMSRLITLPTRSISVMFATLSRLSVLPVILLAGCAAVTPPKVDIAEPTQARPSAAAYAPVNNGAIFQAGGYRPLYETHRARMVGDIITVNISESVAAKQETTSSLDKTGTVSSSITAAPLLSGSKLAQLAKLNAEGSSSNSFDGKGSTESTGKFTGTTAGKLQQRE